MRFDFSSVDDVESYVSIPAGTHNVRIAEVREGRAKDGSVRWTFRLEVLDGDYAGRTAAWDSLTWSERGIFRVKKVLEALGLDTSGELEVDPADLLDLQVRVVVQPEEREDPLTGRRQVRMRVPYLGYAPFEKDATSQHGAEGDGADRNEGAHERRAVDEWKSDGESDAHAAQNGRNGDGRAAAEGEGSAREARGRAEDDANPASSERAQRRRTASRDAQGEYPF